MSTAIRAKVVAGCHNPRMHAAPQPGDQTNFAVQRNHVAWHSIIALGLNITWGSECKKKSKALPKPIKRKYLN